MSGALVGGLLLLLAPLVGDPGLDYTFDEEAWQGIGYLLVTGDEARVQIEVHQTWDLSRALPDDIVMWLYPETPPPTDEVLAFIHAVGHLILADDLGASEALLERLGVTREPGPSRHERWYQGRDGLPILAPRGDHFLC